MSSAPVDVERRTIKHLAQSKWRSSGLSDAAAKRLRLRPVRDPTLLNARFKQAGALLIPYFNLFGEPTKFYRIRYLERLPGMEGQVAKPQKYDQLPVMQEVYYPPLMKQSWQAVANDSKIEVAITEGELKAACATYSQVIPCMALGGVYSFMSSKRGIDLLPSLKQFVWKDRVVYVVYDNDLGDNPDVMRAQRMLADRLLAEGARVRFGSIPAGPAKGIDDYIVAHGVDAFKEILERAQPYGEGSALWKMNEEVVFIRNTDIVVERATKLIMQPDRFTRHVYANRFYMEQVEKGKGDKRYFVLEKAPLAPRWLEWEQRAELDKITYAPGQPRVTLEHGSRAFNMWDGWGLTPKRGSVEQWHWLMDFIFGRDQKTKKWFERWCAYPIQNPGAKLYTAVVLWSRVKRLGKSMIAIAISKIYGLSGDKTYQGVGRNPCNAVIIDSKQLKGGFNSWAKNRQLVVGEEITAGEARVDADWLKGTVTGPTFTINEKFLPEIVIPNYTNFLFLSNHPDAMFLEDGDKRYMIHAVPRNEPAPREKYEWCDKWLHGDGPAHLMDYLLRMDLRKFNPREHAPDTMSKFQMIVAGKTDVGLWVLRLQEDPRTALRPLGERPAAECDLFTSEQLHRAFDPEGRWTGRGVLASLGKALINAGFRHVNGGQPMLTGDGKIHRLIAIRNPVKWEQATRPELREHYDQFFGPEHAGEVK